MRRQPIFVLKIDATGSGYELLRHCRMLIVGREVKELWLPKDDLRDSSSWSLSPLLFLRDIHSKLLTQYDCKEVCAPSQS
jgi:hypothetical protein